MCQLPAYNLSTNFQHILLQNNTNVSTALPPGSPFVAQIVIAGMLNTSSESNQGSDVNDGISSQTSIDTFSVSLLIGLSLDGYSHYDNLKESGISYNVTYSFPEFDPYEGTYNPESQSLIRLKVSF